MPSVYTPNTASVRAVALLTALMGVVNVLSAATPGLRDRLVLLRPVLPLEVRYGSHLAATLSGFALLLLARGLWRRKKASWSLSLVLLCVSAVSHLLKGLDFEESGLAVGLALWLWRLRPGFQARSDRPTVRHAVGVCAAAALFTLAYGVVGLALLDHHFSRDFYPGTALAQVWVMLTQFTDPVPVTRFGAYFADSVYTVAAVTLGYALLALARPVLVREAASPSERLRARAIVEAYGRSSLAWFTLFDDKSYFFSPGGSLVAFVVTGDVCLALGDPIGPAGDLAATITGFCDFCARCDWRPAFAGAEPETLSLYHDAGLDTLCIGGEAIVNLGTWTLAGGRMKDMRGRVSRLTKLGFVARLHSPPLSAALLDSLREVSGEWLSAGGREEMCFLIGAFDEDVLRQCPVMAVHDPQGRVCAFANVYPEYGKSEATVDLMRRLSRTENGTMEFLFAALFDWARGEGFATFNLGLSPLAGVGHDTDDPVAERALRYLFEHSGQFYNFKGLHRFKAKFHPCWSPRFLVYPGPASLVPVILAVLRAQAGGDGLWRRLLRGRGGDTSYAAAEDSPPAPNCSQERKLC